MITIRLVDGVSQVVDDIENFTAELDQEVEQVKIYHNNKFVGIFDSVIGMPLDSFIEQIKEYVPSEKAEEQKDSLN